MERPFTANYELLGVYILGGICFVVLMLGLSRALQSRGPSAAQALPYECGEQPIGSASRLFALRYYLMALLFVLFEVEMLFLLPWARVMGAMQQLQSWGWVAFAEISFFIALLLLAWVYAWKKGNLGALGPTPRVVDIPSKVPETIYESLNTRYEQRKHKS